ncbi:MAG: TonB-dependent receptor plug [Chitinophagaceae bacterium]|nr:TonB-dependent receptor plug [Chitinophagaceae bacterium]
MDTIQNTDMSGIPVCTAFPVKGKSCHCFAKRQIPVFFVSTLFLFISTSFAQQKINGIVVSDDLVPVNGATITVKSSGRAIVTAADGSFSINAKAGDVLGISFVGYQTQQITIANEKNLKIILHTNILSLDDVVVTGYLSQRVKEITGSVAIVKPKDLIAVPAGQVEQMLQGRVAGLNIITSGEPGSQSNVRIHGIGNFGDVTPLYIIDGVEGNINSLNPYDIESLQVLKDAGSYSVYGVRGANGVIIITTRKGRIGKTSISYDSYIGTTRPLKKGLDLLTPKENADRLWIALKNSDWIDPITGNPSDRLFGNGPVPVLPDYLFAGTHVGLFEGDPLVNPDKYNIDPGAGEIYQIVRFNKTGTDWFHEGFKPAPTQNHTVTVSGGRDNNHYLFSVGYLDQQGTLINTYLKRYTTRINTDFTVMNLIRIGENLQFNYSQNPRTNSLFSIGIEPFLLTNPYLPVYDIKGNSSSFGPAGIGGVASLPGPAGNPASARILSKDDKDNNWQVSGNAYAEIDLLKKFTFKSSFGGALNYYYSYNYNYGSYEPPPSGKASSFYERSGYLRSWTWTNTLSYAGTFHNNHNIKAIAGTEQKSNYNRELGGSRLGYFTNDPSYRFLTTGNPGVQSNYSFAGISYLSSFIGQLNYNYEEKYFASGTLRRDGSSIFGPRNRFGWFPAISAAWRITEEKFMKRLNWLTELKLRGSWGKTGFFGNTDPFNQYTLYGGGAGGAFYDINGTNNSIQQGFRTVRFGNAETGWQEDIVINMGLESAFWNGKLNITADWYNKKSTGLLFKVALPALLGDATSPNVNVGEVNNKGIDLSLGSKGRFSKNWRWDVLITFSHYNNKIVKLNDIPFFDGFYAQNGAWVRNEVGYPVSSFYGYKIIGFFQDSVDIAKSPTQDAAKPGRFKYLDANADGIISDADRVHFGNPSPHFTLGLNIGINYRNFDFSTFLYGSFGNDVLNRFKNLGKAELYDSWTPQHANAKTPIAEMELNFSNGEVPNSYWMEKGSYLRNKTMILGYTFPKQWLQKIKIDRCRIYVQAVNLFTITKYTGLDPELSGINSNYAESTHDASSAFGIDFFGNYPNNQKQWIVGFNLGL